MRADYEVEIARMEIADRLEAEVKVFATAQLIDKLFGKVGCLS